MMQGAGKRAGLVVALAIGLILPFAAVAADAPDNAAEEARRHRINIAGHQRMLSQRMAKAICFALIGVQPGIQNAAAIAAADRFDRDLAGLIFGTADRTLSAEQNPRIRAALHEVQGISQGLTASVRQLASGDLHSVAMALVLQRNMPTLARMNDAVQMIEDAAGAGVLDPSVAATINQAGRQRMLIQKIAKDACFVTAGLKVMRSRASLQADAAEFDATLAGLLHGNRDKSLLAPPDLKFTDQLEKVAALWSEVKPRIEGIIRGDLPTAGMLEKLADDTDRMLAEMDRVVTLWVAHSG